MVYGHSITLKKISKEEWDELKKSVEIYELLIPSSKKLKKQNGIVESYRTKEEDTTRYYRGSNRDKLFLLQVTDCWSNSKGTVKVIRAGKEHTAVFARGDHIEGYTSLDTGDWGTKSDVFDHIDRGTWLICPQMYDGTDNEIELAFCTNEKTIDDVKKIIKNLYEMDEIRSNKSDYNWKPEQIKIKCYGTLNLKEVLQQRLIFDLALRRFEWLHRKERWDLWNSVKANLSMKKGKTKFIVKVKTALDGNTWLFEAPATPIEEKVIGWKDESLYKLDWWLPFVYRKPNDNFFKKPKAEQTMELMGHFLQLVNKLPQDELKMGFNARMLVVTRKETSKGAVLNYLDGKLVAADSIKEKMKDYFVNKKPIVEEPQETETNSEDSARPKIRVLSIQAQRLIDEGLNGEMVDLEGRFPFHLNIIYKEDERKWYIECAGKLFYVKGGQTALKKIKSAITGTAVVDHNKYGYRWSRSRTRLIRDRLAELVGDKNALWITLNVKKMGALMKAIGAEN